MGEGDSSDLVVEGLGGGKGRFGWVGGGRGIHVMGWEAQQGGCGLAAFRAAWRVQTYLLACGSANLVMQCKAGHAVQSWRVCAAAVCGGGHMAVRAADARQRCSNT